MVMTLFTKGKPIIEALEDRCVNPVTLNNREITSFPSQSISYGIELPSPLNSMLIALFASYLRLNGVTPEKLLSERSEGAYRYPTVSHRGSDKNVTEAFETVQYKKDSLALDTLPEETIARFLLATESHDSDEFTRAGIWYAEDPVIRGMFNFHGRSTNWQARNLESLRTVISEECGIFPNVNKLEKVGRLFILDPLDGSKLLENILKTFPGNTLEEKLKEYASTVDTTLLSPAISITCVQEGISFVKERIVGMYSKQRVTSNVVLNLSTRVFYVADSEGESIKKYTMKIVSNGDIHEIRLGYAKPQTLEFRTFSDVDKDRFVCHNTPGDYQRNLDSLNLPQNLSRYQLPNTPGPARPLFLTNESPSHRPRFILYNGEKISEWAGVMPWLQVAGLFNMYVVSNPNAPEKGGHSMAPTRTKNIHDKDGYLDMSKLNNQPSPAQYRSTIAIVYKDDRELNDHLSNLGAMQINL